MKSVEIEEAVSDLVQQPFDSDEFTLQSLAAFRNEANPVSRIEGSDVKLVPSQLTR